MVSLAGSVAEFRRRWIEHLNGRFSNIFPDALPQGKGRWLEKTVDGDRPADISPGESFSRTELLRGVRPDDIRFRFLKDVLDWELEVRVPRFVWMHVVRAARFPWMPVFEDPPPPWVTIIADPDPLIGPWEHHGQQSGWGPNPLFSSPQTSRGPRPTRPTSPNEIPLQEVDDIKEVGAVVRRWNGVSLGDHC